MELLRQTLDSTRQSIDAAEEAVIDFSRRAGLTRTGGARLGLAVREIFTNAVVHGNRYDVSKKVLLQVSRSTIHIVVVVADEGSGFDVGSVPNPLTPDGLLRASGRGLLLARKLVDEFHIGPGDEGGTRITLVKYLRSSATEPQPATVAKRESSGSTGSPNTTR
jgi:serine/threonine-protein kinase RsbW